MSRIGEIYLEDAIVDGGYGVDFSAGIDQLSDWYADVDAAAVDFPWIVAYCTCDSARSGLMLPDRVPTAGAPLWSDPDIMKLSVIVAAEHDAVWKTGGGINQGWYFGAPPLSRARIFYPHGSFYVNHPFLVNYGEYLGCGTSGSNPDLNSPITEVSYGTTFSIWHEEWIDDGTGSVGAAQRIAFKSVNWVWYNTGDSTWYAGILGASGGGFDTVFNGYMEGTKIKDCKILGRKDKASEAMGAGGNNYVTTYECYGIALLRMGSTSGLEEIYADNFNNCSYLLYSATPGYLKNLRGMFNNFASMMLLGDGEVTIDGYESDDCPSIFYTNGLSDQAGGYLITPGCGLLVNGLKIETGTAGNDNRKGSMILDATGWTSANININKYVGLNSYPEGLCRCEPFPTGFTGTSSWIRISGIKVFGFVRTLMHHADANGQSKKWLLDKGEYTVKYNSEIHAFEYSSGTSAGGAIVTTSTGVAPRYMNVPYQNRQAWLPSPLSGASWTDTTDPGTPVYDYTPV